MLCSLLLALGGMVAFAAPPTPGPNRTPAAIAPDAAELLTALDRRVRTIDARIQSLLEQGLRRSTTFAALMRAVNRTDVIVYIEPVRQLPPAIAGRVLMLPRVDRQRYLRIQVRAQIPGNDLISTIGHELQHALEIAGAAEVQDQDALERLYKRIGRSGPGAHTYDTDAAQMAGRLIRAELAG